MVSSFVILAVNLN